MSTSRALLRKCVVGFAAFAFVALMAAVPNVPLRADPVPIPDEPRRPEPPAPVDQSSTPEIPEPLPQATSDPYDSSSSSSSSTYGGHAPQPRRGILMFVTQAPPSQLLLNGAVYGCTAFTNTSTQTVKRVVLQILVDGWSGFGSTLYSSRGPFAPGHSVTNACVDHNVLSSVGASLQSADFLKVSPIEVDYADGSSWNAGPDLLGQSKSGNPDVVITRTFMWKPEGECSDIFVVGTHPVKRIQVSFAHANPDGTVRRETLEINGNYKQGDIQTMNCRPSQFDEQAGLMVGSVTRVDYQDGTAWTVPSQQQ